MLSQARGGVGGARGREELAEVFSPSQRKFPDSRARMGSNSILPSAGEATAGQWDEEVKVSRCVPSEWHMGSIHRGPRLGRRLPSPLPFRASCKPLWIAL